MRAGRLSLSAFLIAAAVALAPQAASAQGLEPREERLYFGTQTLLGSSRLVGLGGAYVAIAEGADGFSANLAALAHRAPTLTRRWDVGFLFAWLDVPVTSNVIRDLDNDGRRDDTRASTHLLGGILLQYERFGLGSWIRSSARAYCVDAITCDPRDRVWIRLQQTSLAGAVALGREDFVLGIGLFLAEATFDHHGETWRYGGNGLELDALYRPHGLPYRVGLSVKPEVTARYRPNSGQEPVIEGRTLYSAAVSPGVLSLGVAYRLGAGAHHFNRLSPAAKRNVEERFGPGSAPPELPPGTPTGRWLVAGQIDFVAPVDDALPVSSFTALTPLDEPDRVGGSFMIAPRAGVEHETLPHRLRTRLGAFVEPSPFRGGNPRPHLTGGVELFLFHYLDDWEISAAFDVARQYANFGLALGFWR